jgi:hypothetical protein
MKRLTTLTAPVAKGDQVLLSNQSAGRAATQFGATITSGEERDSHWLIGYRPDYYTTGMGQVGLFRINKSGKQTSVTRLVRHLA